ncbi:hypothetical protein FAM6165_02083 [Lacticaseibacillus paracasei]|uniref:hypothetical protein n=1 Tax=Lacticaseibacillus paracasei TaxID=1597 RepID=UPI000FF0DC94|nr:hypothetical protein [Lacticaseibacillus paracasei]RNE28392.1 hypothetical protein FAM6165_02083 [Lacticaseibacillus paracasei]
MANKMSHQTIVLQCSNDIDTDLLLTAIEQGTDGVNQVSYLLDAYGQKTIEKALPALTHDFDFLGVTDDEND